MEIQKNMATVIRALKESSGKTITEFSDELEISRSALQEYMSGKGNPSISTVNHLAHKLGVDASFLVSGVFSHSQLVVLVKLLELLNFLSKLPAAHRTRFAELLLEILTLMGDADENDMPPEEDLLLPADRSCAAENAQP